MGTEVSPGVASAWTPPRRRSASTTDELRTQLRDGQTIAEVAEAEGVDIETVKDAMLEAFRTHQQEHVTAERLTPGRRPTPTSPPSKSGLDELVSKTLSTRPDAVR